MDFSGVLFVMDFQEGVIATDKLFAKVWSRKVNISVYLRRGTSHEAILTFWTIALKLRKRVNSF